MYTPSYRVRKNGVPVLKQEEIDTIGEEFVRDFQPGVLTDPEPVDVEGFIECYLGMTTDYQYLSHNGIYLGMTVFNDTDNVIVWSPETNQAEYISARARTVIVDNRLLEDNQEHRYRFTLGHEGGHDIFHTAFFHYDPNQLSLLDTPMAPMIQCRRDNTQTGQKNPRCWNDHDRMEYQANRFSSAFLMPKSAVKLLAQRHRQESRLVRNIALVHDMVETFDVSMEAATYRLKDLGIVEKDFSVPYAGMDFIEVYEDELENATDRLAFEL